MEKQEVQKGGFDPLVVHLRDSKTNRVLKANAFRVIVEKGTRFYEWPKSSGNLWYENRLPAGRLDEDGSIIRGKEHQVWNAPVTEDQRIGELNEALKQDNKKLAAELAAIKAEQEMALKHKSVKKAAEVNKVTKSAPKSAKVEVEAK